jgi:hypothetical protein
MLKIFRFDKRFSCYLQGECVLDGCFRKPYIEQAVGGEWDAKDLIGGTEERAVIQSVTSMWLEKRCDEKSDPSRFTRHIRPAVLGFLKHQADTYSP